MAVVIAAHERDLERRVRAAPLPEGGIQAIDASRPRVEEVAEDDEARRTRSLDEHGEALEIGGRAAARQWNAARAKGRCLAEMQIGDEHRRTSWPMQRTLRVQAYPLAGYDNVVNGLRADGCTRQIERKLE